MQQSIAVGNFHDRPRGAEQERHPPENRQPPATAPSSIPTACSLLQAREAQLGPQSMDAAALEQRSIAVSIWQRECKFRTTPTPNEFHQVGHGNGTLDLNQI
jgi:hypothetical protein